LHLLIIGWGYTARHLALSLDRSQCIVTTTSRRVDTVTMIDELNIECIPFTQPYLEDQLSQCTHCLITAPCEAAGIDPTIRLLSDCLAQPHRELQWVGYLSSTSVYGDHHGAWVSERSPLLAKQPRGVARIAAEKDWLTLFYQHQLPVHIFRLAGIYGPQRNAIDNIRQGKKTCVVKPEQVFSRVHVHDIARALHCSMKEPTPGAIYNIADDLPSSPESVYDLACELLQQPALSQCSVDDKSVSEMTKSFYSSCRRVSNATFKKQFNFNYRYPSYREGLKALLRH